MCSQPSGTGEPRRFHTGVDAVRLLLPFEVNGSLPNFKVKKRWCIRERPPRWIEPNNLLYLNDDEPVVGAASLWTDGPLRVRIARAHITRGPVMCWLKFNPARLLRNSNTRTVDAADLLRALQEADRRLQAQGLLADFGRAKISHIEIARDIHVPREVERYWPLLHRLDTPYNTRGSNYPNGLMRGSKSVQLCLYGKNNQVRQAGQSAAGLPGPNTIRIEWRLRNTQSVGYHLGSNSLSRFIARFSMLSDKMDRFLGKSLFQEPLPLYAHIAELNARVTSLDEWTALLESVGADKKHVKQLLAIHAYDRMIDEIGWETADQLLAMNFAAAASSLSTLRRDLRRSRLLYLRSRHGIPYAQLYIELHRATFALLSHDDDFVRAALPFIPLKDVP